MSDKEEALLRMSHELIEALQEIKLICEKAKAHYIEESDIDEILGIAKRHV